MPESWNTKLSRILLNAFPAYVGTGGKITYIAGDWREVHIAVPLGLRTRNYVGSIFGGSMYGAVDPVYMVMLIKVLGPEYVVWDKAASIRFRRAGRSTLRAVFRLDQPELDAIREGLLHTRSIERTYTIDLVDASDQICATVEKRIYIRRQDADAGRARSNEIGLARQARSAVDLFHRRVAASGGRPALRFKQDGAWRSVSWMEWEQAAGEIAAGLHAHGIVKGDRVCLMAQNRHEWVLAAVGVMLGGGVLVPIYALDTAEQAAYIVADSGARFAFVENAAQLDKLRSSAANPRLPAQLAHTVLLEAAPALDSAAERERLSTLAELRATGARLLAERPQALDAIRTELSPPDLAMIIYTSGTTGPRKGAQLTHHNILFECRATDEILPLGEEDEQIMVLPLAGVFATMLVWLGVAKGMATGFAQSRATFLDDIRVLRPTFVGAAPLFFERVFLKVRTRLDAVRRIPGAAPALDWVLAPGAGSVRRRLAERLVYAKVRDALGARVRFCISAGAPLATELGEFFRAAGVLILEGYGMTETCSATHITRPHALRFGSVGPPLPGQEVMIAGDGEVLLRGENLMAGYHGKPAETRAAIDDAGWYHSGDIGRIDADGFLWIVDRKKEMIAMADGKKIAPQKLETLLKTASPYVANAMVCGEGRAELTALVTLNEETARAWARAHRLGDRSLEDLAASGELAALVQQAVDRVNAEVAAYERITRFALLPRDFTLEADELTPTFKLRRKVITERHHALLESLQK